MNRFRLSNADEYSSFFGSVSLSTSISSSDLSWRSSSFNSSSTVLSSTLGFDSSLTGSFEVSVDVLLDSCSLAGAIAKQVLFTERVAKSVWKKLIEPEVSTRAPIDASVSRKLGAEPEAAVSGTTGFPFCSCEESGLGGSSAPLAGLSP
ncbi:hypothetical protein OGAPHI_005799 [Ogataea philodendri]|uniref:Uncharacterized protein n=1 Tax=Ogataea philodendri TaxID=1378263 RepID=A0A9P8P0E0_9ASCO|nr:uncharacterized protein OGAPHI_005799 [Ogataea philodendri]KAH3662547.1 hypothetical protein OGAPHI_005799 [Ogataea philodendri]